MNHELLKHGSRITIIIVQQQQQQQQAPHLWLTSKLARAAAGIASSSATCCRFLQLRPPMPMSDHSGMNLRQSSHHVGVYRANNRPVDGRFTAPADNLKKQLYGG
jgi:hypothetical protein